MKKEIENIKSVLNTKGTASLHEEIEAQLAQNIEDPECGLAAAFDLDEEVPPPATAPTPEEIERMQEVTEYLQKKAAKEDEHSKRY